jgi:hydroxypyruvate isomerase
MMNRRAFAQTLAGAVAGAYVASHISNLAGEDKSEETGVPFKLSVMLWTVFTDLPFEQRLEKVAEAGYKNVELVGNTTRGQKRILSEPILNAKNSASTSTARPG